MFIEKYLMGNVSSDYWLGYGIYSDIVYWFILFVWYWGV